MGTSDSKEVMFRSVRTAWIAAALSAAQAVAVSTPARADPGSAMAKTQASPAAPVEPADALFEEGKRLRASGKTDEACSKFAQSQGLAPGVGITLHLADCYERLGRTASAWIEFTMAEKAARDASDRREATARTRAEALAPRLGRVTVAVPAATPGDDALVQLDGRTVPPSMWNVAMVIDPGDHLVTFQKAGAERRTFPVHVDDASPSVTVQVVEPVAPAPAVTPVAPYLPSAPPAASTGDSGAATRQWVEVGLLGGAAVAAGVGAALLVVKNDSMSNTGADGRPYVDPVAAAASKIVFAAAGAAAASAIVLYLTTPHPGDTALYLTSTPVAGGASATLGGTF